jgi:hypothetical protein
VEWGNIFVLPITRARGNIFNVPRFIDALRGTNMIFGDKYRN